MTAGFGVVLRRRARGRRRRRPIAAAAQDDAAHRPIHRSKTPQHARTCEEELNAAGGLNLPLVLLALLAEVLRVAVEQVHVGRVDVNVLEEVVPHEGVVALGVVAGQAAVPGRGGSRCEGG